MAFFGDVHLDYIKEILNIGVGRGAKILNDMLGSHIILMVPEILLIDTDSNGAALRQGRLAVVDLPFSGVVSGISKLVFPQDDSRKLVAALTSDELIANDEDLDPLSEGALAEVGNIVLNAVMGVISNQLAVHLTYQVPRFCETEGLFGINQAYSSTLLAKIVFTAELLDISGEIAIIFETGGIDALAELIDLHLAH